MGHKLKWDKDAKYWYTTNVDTWNSLQQFHKTYYDVPFDAKDIVKKYGYKWDRIKKHWYGCDYIRRQNMEDLAEFEPIDI
jgi:hypothetical protein